jgi:DNA-binding HxlR family transcriptional regulator
VNFSGDRAMSSATVTDLGRSLDEPLAALERWTASYWHRVEAARQR